MMFTKPETDKQRRRQPEIPKSRTQMDSSPKFKSNRDMEEDLMKNKDTEAVPKYLSQDVIFQILKRLPAKELQEKLRYICKAWHNIISSNKFIAQNTRQNKSQLLITSPTTTESVIYQAKLLEMNDEGLDSKISNVMHRMGMIKSSCNGLILVDHPKKRGLLQVMNLLTKCCLTLPKCGSGCQHKDCGPALGFDLCKQRYKVVHIYADPYGFEIFTLGSSENAWKRIPGPFKYSHDRPFDIANFKWRDPVSIRGQVLHWHVGSNDYIISMNVSDEILIKTYLPSCEVKTNGCRYDLLEISEKLAFVYPVSDTQIDIWILEDLIGMNWVKRQSIIAGSINYIKEFKPSVPFKTLPNFKQLVAVAALRDGEVMMFKHINSQAKESGNSYLYDINQRVLKKFIRMKIKSNRNFIPHRDSLLCWGNETELLEKRLSSQTSS